MRWSPDEDDRLLSYARQGLTAQAISAHLHPRSKNSVISRLIRLGAPLSRVCTGVPLPTPSARLSPRRATGPARRTVPQERNALPSCAAGRAPSHSNAAERAICALRSGECRWPVGDPLSPQFHFCGAPASRRSGVPLPYCATHAAAAYQPRIRRVLRRQGAA